MHKHKWISLISVVSRIVHSKQDNYLCTNSDSCCGHDHDMQLIIKYHILDSFDAYC